jgi:hypothetical protein
MERGQTQLRGSEFGRRSGGKAEPERLSANGSQARVRGRWSREMGFFKADGDNSASLRLVCCWRWSGQECASAHRSHVLSCLFLARGADKEPRGSTLSACIP